MTYARMLSMHREDVLRTAAQEIGRAIPTRHTFQTAINGFAAVLDDREAARVATLPGVNVVRRARVEHVLTDAGPQWIGATDLWSGAVPGVAATKGEGVVIGIIDTGINHLHPSFAAVGQDGYVHTNPYGDGVFRGECNDFPGLCNNKLIGAYYYLQAHGGTDPLTPPGDPNTKDTDGHGSHTASTAAGNVVIDPPFLDVFGNDTGVTLGTISGVAPHANIIAYKVCAPDCGAADRVHLLAERMYPGQALAHRHTAIRFQADRSRPLQLVNFAAERFRCHGCRF